MAYRFSATGYKSVSEKTGVDLQVTLQVLKFITNGRADAMKNLLMRQRTISRTHKCRYNLQCLSEKNVAMYLKHIKVSLQYIFIASALPFMQL
jgi:hypothetical protein